MSNKYVSWVLNEKFRIEKHCRSGETFCFHKRLLSVFKFSASSNLLFPYDLLIGPQPTFLECIVIFL